MTISRQRITVAEIAADCDVRHGAHGNAVSGIQIALIASLALGMLTGRLWISVGMHIGWDFTDESLLGVNATSGLPLSSPDPAHPV